MLNTLTPVLAGGAIGAAVTHTDQPYFNRTSGVPTYADGGGGRVGMRPPSGAFGQLHKDGVPSGKWGLAWKTKFEANSTTTAYYFSAALQDGTTVLADVGLRNVAGTPNGRRPAFRNNFVYAWESPNAAMTAGEVWSFHWRFDGLAATLDVWNSDIDFAGTVPPPSFTSPTVNLVRAPNALFFGSSGSTGVLAVHSDMWATDGEPAASAPAPGNLDFISNAWATGDEFIMVARVTGALEAALTIAGETETGTPDGAGYVRFSFDGLPPATTRTWSLAVDGVERRTGTTRVAGTTSATTFGWGSCFDTNTSGVFSLIGARNPDFFAMLGDWGYQYITGGPNGNTSPTDVATVRAHREPVLRAAAPQGFFSSVATSYTYSDCDGAGANADGTTGGHATGAIQAAYRQQFAHPSLPDEATGYRSWQSGGVLYIHTDEAAAASPKTNPDNATKTKLGAAQKALFLAALTDAATRQVPVIWFGDGPWIEPTGSGGATGNSWAKYATERAEIGAHIEATGVKIVRLHGDTHTLFYDDGTNNPWGGFPTASAAPMHTTAQPFGYTVSGGKYPTATLNGARQYGIGQVIDNAGELSLNIRGYSSTSAAPTEVERFNAAIPLSYTSTEPPTPISQAMPGVVGLYAGGSEVVALAVGADLIWGK